MLLCSMRLPNSVHSWLINKTNKQNDSMACRIILFCRKPVEYCASFPHMMRVALLTSAPSITGCCSSGPTDEIPMRFSRHSERGFQGLFIDINYGPYLTIYIFKKVFLIYRFIDHYRSQFTSFKNLTPSWILFI